jgi:hypothetical protein
LEKRSEQVLLGSEGHSREEEGGSSQGEEVAQAMYTHVNKCINNKKGAKKKVKKGDNKNRNKNKRGKIFFKEN